MDNNKHTTLAQLEYGHKAEILGIWGDFALKQRLVEMGFVQGATVQADQTAPLDEPKVFTIRGYQISLRETEAEQIILKSGSIKKDIGH
ncbi:MAG: ferrous iron transport protein A [Magnetococcales bacterium]|nr:ferrous iron transport protein A [Magnetococcales bacterium]